MSNATAHMNVMSAAEFANRTTATKAVCGFKAKFKSRGGNMDEIDCALQTWDQVCVGKDTTRKRETLHRTDVACARWLSRKRDKSSTLANFRRDAIKELRQSIKLAMHFLEHKADMAGNAKATQSLGDGYSLERNDYLAAGKAQNPFAASGLEGSLYRGQRVNLGVIGDVNEYRQIAAAVTYGGNESRVEYLNRATRMSLMAYIEGGRFYLDSKVITSKLDTDLYSAGEQVVMAGPYAVDRHGNMFHKAFKSGEFQLNHSSFTAGREVLCAGTAVWENGYLKYITNLSGHYKPSTDLMCQYLALLGEENVDLRNVCVVVNDNGTMRRLKADTFLKSTHAADDWPDTTQVGVKVNISGRLYRVKEPT